MQEIREFNQTKIKTQDYVNRDIDGNIIEQGDVIRVVKAGDYEKDGFNLAMVSCIGEIAVVTKLSFENNPRYKHLVYAGNWWYADRTLKIVKKKAESHTNQQKRIKPKRGKVGFTQSELDYLKKHLSDSLKVEYNVSWYFDNKKKIKMLEQIQTKIKRRVV